MKRGPLISILTGAVLCLSAAQTVAPVPVRVMTFNIRYGSADDGENSWKYRRPLVAGVVQEASPDIIGVQEALRFQLDHIAADLPGYREVGAGRDDGGTKGEYAAILVRADRFTVLESGTYWFSETPEVPGSMDWGNRIPRICTWARVRDMDQHIDLSVFNVHWDHESQESRLRSAALLLQSIAHFTDEGEPVIVTGDFNAGEKNPAFLRLLGDDQIRLTDSFRSVHTDAQDVGTFNAFTGDRKGDKIDAILVSTEWGVRDAEIVRTAAGGRYPSDHFPVTATLMLRQRR